MSIEWTYTRSCAWAGAIAAASFLFFGVAAAAEYRPMLYTDWQSAHPDADAKIADLKERTDALVAPALARFEATQPAPEVLYPDLIGRSQALSDADRTQSQALFHTAMGFWLMGEFPAAENGFREVLNLDPANAAANYYYGDCLKRRNSRDDAAEHMKRAFVFGGASHEADLARATALELPSPEPTSFPPDPRIHEPPRIFKVPGAIDTIIDCDVCPEMAVIPAGEFTMGSPPDEPARVEAEVQHRVFIAYPLAVAKTPVTFDQWQACIDDGGCGNYMPDDGTNGEHWGRGNRPVINVNFRDVELYIEWLSKKTGKHYRLLTETEFEYAQRGGTTTTFYWGNTPSRDYANYGTDECCGPFAAGRDQWMTTSPVGSFPPNPFGLYDMAGNVFQWAMGCYKSAYEPGAPVDGSPWLVGDCTRRPLRGGAWYDDPSYLRSAKRHTHTTPLRGGLDGFRVARWL